MELPLIRRILSNEATESAIIYLEQKKNSCGPDGIYLSELRRYWEINREALLTQLENGTYEPGTVRSSEIVGRNGKRRVISVFNSLDRMILRCLAQYLEPVLEKSLHENCMAFRTNLGVSSAVSRIAHYISQGYAWEVRADIKDYFDNISLPRLEQMLAERLEDSMLLQLIGKYLHISVICDEGIRPVTHGILQGSPLSPLLGNLYLAPLDFWMESVSPAFCRYADDIAVCFQTKEEAEAFLPVIRERLRGVYGLETNMKKTAVIETARQNYLGYSFHISREDGTVTAVRASRSQDEIYGDWRRGHIESTDGDYHLVSDGILSKKDYSLLFENEEQKRYLPAETMGALNIYSDVIFSSGFFEFAARKHLFISIFDRHGELMGSFLPAESGSRNKTLLRQAAVYTDSARRMQAARALELAALHNLRANIRYYAKTRQSESLRQCAEALSVAIREINESKSMEQMLLTEARARQLYYSAFNDIIPSPDFRFIRRTRRPPKDPLNAMLSFGNTYLYQKAATEITKSSLDIRIGIIHATNKRSQSLNLDLAEIFKPLVVDRAIFTLINKRSIGLAHFEAVEGGGVYLNTEGKRLFLNELDEKLHQQHTDGGRTVTYLEQIREEVRKILRFVMKGETYRPYKYY